MRYRFIEAKKELFPIQVLCETLRVSRSGYFAWRGRPESKRARDNRGLVKQIQTSHRLSDQTYGSPRVWEDLLAQGVQVGRHRVARLMRQQQLRSKRRRRYRVTTNADHRWPVAANLLLRDFRACAPNRKWSADITHVRTRKGWLYLAVVLDLYSRRVVGWSMASHLSGTLVIAALRMAIKARQPPARLIHHSDQGVQYASREFQRLLARHKIQMLYESSR